MKQIEEEVIFSLSKVECENCNVESNCPGGKSAPEYEIFKYDCTYHNFYYFDQTVIPSLRNTPPSSNCTDTSPVRGISRDLCCTFSGSADLLFHVDHIDEINHAWNGRNSSIFAAYDCNFVEISNPQQVQTDWVYWYNGYGYSGNRMYTGELNLCGISEFVFEPLLQSCGLYGWTSYFNRYSGTLTYPDPFGLPTWNAPTTPLPKYESIWVRPKFCTALPFSSQGDFDCPVGTCTTKTLAIGTQCVITGAGCGPDGGTCSRNDPGDRSSPCGCQQSPNYLKTIFEFEWKGESPP